MDYSVLMSVYHRENPEYLRKSMNSMFAQTAATNDFVLVCDGPLTPELDAVIAEMEVAHPDVLRVVRLEENVGLGCALNTGVQYCRNALIARMDSDDIALPERCEMELVVMEEKPDVSIVGSVIEEFSKDESVTDSKRVVPQTHEEILQFAKTRNPFNHPSVMYRKQAVLDAGNYQTVRYMQDYYLWVAMLMKGFKGYNIQQPLVRMRANENLFKRRSGWQYIKIQLDLFGLMRKNGFISVPRYLLSCVIRICSGVAPNGMRQLVFKKVLRRH